MKKICFFILTMLSIISMAAITNASNERKWYFQDSQFDSISNGDITSNVTTNGLTLGSGTNINFFYSPVKTLYFKRAIYTMKNGSKNSGYLKFSVNGATDIHILGRSKSNEVDRNLTIYTTADNAEYNLNMTPETDDYVYQYRGGAGDVYLYTAGDGVKIFGITAKDYSENEYAPLGESTRRVWEFENYKSYAGIINESINIDGMVLNASSENTMTIGLNSGNKEPYGNAKRTYIDLSGRVRYEGRFITFPVNRNSDIYITARSSDGINDRNLLVWNKYYGTPKTSLTSDVIKIGQNVETYKINYYGDGEDIIIGSEDSGIRIYEISVVPRVKKVIDYNSWDISNSSNFTLGDYNNSVIDGLNLLKATIESNVNTGNKKAIHIRSNVYGVGGRIKFDISDSSNPRGAAIKRTISLKAKSAYDEQVKLILINSSGLVIGCTNLTTEIAEYKFDYTGSYDSIYVYAYYPNNLSSKGAYIYSVDNGKPGSIGPEDLEKVISITANQNYRYFLTCNNIEDVSAIKYTIVYNSDAIRISKIGENPTKESYVSPYFIKHDSNITNISGSKGCISFEINTENKDWSGILCPVEVIAKSTGNTTIKVLAEMKS